MKKHLLILFCVLTLLVSSIPVAAAGTASLRTADKLATLGLVDSAGAAVDYHLDEPATRAQAALLLVRLSGAAVSGTARADFRDVPAWAAAAVHYAAQQGWVSGFSEREFRPDTVITANAWCTMLLRMLGYSDRDGDFTIHDAPVFAQRIGLISRKYTGNMTRGDLFETMQDALTFPYPDGSGTVISRLVSQGACSRAAANALGLLDAELTAQEAAARHMSSVFCLELFRSEADIKAKTGSSNSSGFFISKDGLAVTNHHSIEGAIHAIATLSTGEQYEVEKVIYYDEDIDIAVIRVSQVSVDGKVASAFAPLDLAGTADIYYGDIVYTLGNPLGLGLAVSSGIISDPARVLDDYALPCVMNTADISKGSSGGALLNIYGQVVAVTAGAYVLGNSMYLAVPIDPIFTADLTVEGITLAQLAALEAE